MRNGDENFVIRRLAEDMFSSHRHHECRKQKADCSLRILDLTTTHTWVRLNYIDSIRPREAVVPVGYTVSNIYVCFSGRVI